MALTIEELRTKKLLQIVSITKGLLRETDWVVISRQKNKDAKALGKKEGTNKDAIYTVFLDWHRNLVDLPDSLSANNYVLLDAIDYVDIVESNLELFPVCPYV